MLDCMERKRGGYLKEWRQWRNLTQKQVVDRLRELSGGEVDDPELRLPTTEASLSRIESGKQNYTIAALEALAEIYQADETGWLLSRNPLALGEVVNLMDFRLSKEDALLARAVLEKMFGNGEAG